MPICTHLVFPFKPELRMQLPCCSDFNLIAAQIYVPTSINAPPTTSSTPKRLYPKGTHHQVHVQALSTPTVNPETLAPSTTFLIH